MLDIFLYNENFWFVNISLNLNNNVIINICSNNNLITPNFLWFDNFYFDNIFFKNNKKSFYSWTTTAHIDYFFNKKILNPYLSSSHDFLYLNSYIFWNLQKIMPLIYLDFSLKNIFNFFNFSNNNTIIFYDNLNTFWDFFFDGYSQKFFFNKSDFMINYYTIFDFKKNFVGISSELFEKKFQMLYYYKNIIQFSVLFKELNVELFSLISNFNFTNFGIFFKKNNLFFDYKFLKNFIIFLFTNNNYNYFVLDNSLLFDFFYKFNEKKGSIFYLVDFDFFKYIFIINYIKLDIFLNHFNLGYQILSNFGDSFSTKSLYDLSISNIHLYNKVDLLPVYSLELKNNGDFFYEVFYNNYKVFDDLKFYFFKLNKINFLKNLFYLDYNTSYFIQFYINLEISKYVVFYLVIFAKKKFILFLIIFLFFLFNLLLFILNFFNFNKIDSNVIVLKLNIFFLFILLFLNFKFKNNKFLINKNFKINKKLYKKYLLNFDLILFVYNKFIVYFFNDIFRKNYNLLRSEYLFFNFTTILKKKNFNFLLFNLFFLIIMLLYFIVLFFFIYIYYINLFVFLNLYKYYYLPIINSLNLSYKVKLNNDGNVRFNWTPYYSIKWYYKFIKYWLNYYNYYNFFKYQLNIFSKFNINKKKNLHNLYINISDAGFFLFWEYSTIFISLLYKRDYLMNFRYFFVYRFYYEILYYIKDSNLNLFFLNIFNYICITEFKLGRFFLNLNIFEITAGAYVLDYSLLDLLKKEQKKYLFSNIFLNIEFENLILKPLNFFIKKYFFNNILIIFFFFTTFLKFLKLEIYLKFLFFYFFNLIFLFFYFFNKNIFYFFNFKYFYFFIVFLNKIKYILFLIFEIIINKIFINIFIFLKKFKIVFITIFCFFYFFNINFIELSILLNSIFFFNNYIYFFIIEFFYYIFETIFIKIPFNYIIKHFNLFFILNEIDLFFNDYKIFVYSWGNVLKEYYLSFEAISTRKAYGINFKLLMFNEYKDSFYAWIPNSFFHTFVRFIVVVFYNKEPDIWFFGIQYFSSFYRLGWDLLGFYVAKGNHYTILDHIWFGFFKDSIFHKFYLGYDLTNLLYYYKFYILKDFFQSKLILGIIYSIIYIYFFLEFFFFKFNIIIFFLFNLFFKNLSIFVFFFWKSIFWLGSLFFYSFSYLYYYIFYIFFEKLYIFLYTIFFINIFLNLFLFLYNFFIYYQETLYGFLNMDIDFIKQNIFNFKYRLTEDMHPLGTWPTYVYKFEQYTWIDNIFKEYFLRNIFFYEFKNLHFFKTFYSFYMNINRITFFLFLIYFYILFRIFQYILNFFNKWFFFTFFNNDWSIARSPALTWDKWSLFSKKNSYYFNEGFSHILGGNTILNYYYYFNNNLDNYIYEQKNQYLYSDKKYKLDDNLIKNSNNMLFFENQLQITKTLWRKKFFNDNFFNWQINSLLFFKNYQFMWYKNLDYIIFKYDKIYGSYSRPWIDKYNSDFIKSFWVDKYNYLFLPPDARVTYTHLFTKDWLFYKDFIMHKRYKNLIKENKIYKLKNLIKKNYLSKNNKLFFSLKKSNLSDLFFLRLQYPFLMFWITNLDLKKKNNNNLKYLFPSLIPKKEVWSLYNDLFLFEKNRVKSISSVPMSGEWLSFFNKSPILPYLTVFSRMDYNLTYDEFSYKGVWNSIENLDRDLFINYTGWDDFLDKYPNFIYVPFYKEYEIIDNLEFNFYKWLNLVSKRYYNYYIPVFNTNSLFFVPKLYEQNLFENLKYRSYDLDYDIKSMEEIGTLNYLSEHKLEDPSEPFTPEEWEDIFREYTENAFLQGDDGIFLMLLYRNYKFNDSVGKVNFISGFIFFFVPFYVFILGSEVYFELSSGFIFEGGLKQPFSTGIVKAMEYYLSMADYDMQDERYFYVNVFEQEMLDNFIRFYQEIFYNFTKYFNGFDYVNSIKKNYILLHDDFLLDNLYDRLMYNNTGRFFKSYMIADDNVDNYPEEDGSWFLMQERKFFYSLSDLSYNIPFFNSEFSNNLWLLFYNFNFLKKNISELSSYNIIIYEIFDFFKKSNNILLDNESILVYKNLYQNKENLFKIFFFSIKEINNNNFFFFDSEINLNKFYFFIFNKTKEFSFWFDKYFLWKNTYIKKEYYYISERNQQILPFFLYNSYTDVVGSTVKIYKNLSYNEDIVVQLKLFKINCSFNDFSLNITGHRRWKRYKRAWYNTFIDPTRTYLYSTINLDWFTKINYLPITSTYLKSFDGSHFYLNNYFLSNFLKSYYLLNHESNIYVDKSTYFTENSNIWQFKISLNEARNYIFFPFFEFALLLLLLSSFFLFICLFFYFFKFEYIINKNLSKNLYYDKVNDIWIYFEFIKKK